MLTPQNPVMILSTQPPQWRHQPNATAFSRFGPFELSEGEGDLRKNGVRIKLQEQPFRVLLEVANAGSIVTREDLPAKAVALRHLC